MHLGPFRPETPSDPRSGSTKGPLPKQGTLPRITPDPLPPFFSVAFLPSGPWWTLGDTIRTGTSASAVRCSPWMDDFANGDQAVSLHCRSLASVWGDPGLAKSRPWRPFSEFLVERHLLARFVGSNVGLFEPICTAVVNATRTQAAGATITRCEPTSSATSTSRASAIRRNMPSVRFVRPASIRESAD